MQVQFNTEGPYPTLPNLSFIAVLQNLEIGNKRANLYAGGGEFDRCNSEADPDL
jgi:hypothetical protein